MLTDNLLNAKLSLKAGKYTHLPNTVMMPRDRKKFPVTFQWATEANEPVVVSATHREARRSWCILDDNLQQLMAASGSTKRASKKTLGHVSRLVHGGGAHNPKDMTVELDGSKLKSGHTYTLVSRYYGVLAAAEFVAIADPKAAKKETKKATKKANKKANKKGGKKKKAAKRKSKKKSARKKPARKKAAKKKPARKKAAGKKSTRKTSARKKPAKRTAAKRKTARKKK